jgi:hypothetical protein
MACTVQCNCFGCAYERAEQAERLRALGYQGPTTHGCKKCEKLTACSCIKAADGGGFEFL